MPLRREEALEGSCNSLARAGRSLTRRAWRSCLGRPCHGFGRSSRGDPPGTAGGEAHLAGHRRRSVLGSRPGTEVTVCLTVPSTRADSSLHAVPHDPHGLLQGGAVTEADGDLLLHPRTRRQGARVGRAGSLGPCPDSFASGDGCDALGYRGCSRRLFGGGLGTPLCDTLESTVPPWAPR